MVSIVSCHISGGLPPGGGLGIFIDKDQRECFLGSDIFENLYFLGTGHSCCIF